MSHWRNTTGRADAMRGVGEDEALYVTGWALSTAATLATVWIVWHFGL